MKRNVFALFGVVAVLLTATMALTIFARRLPLVVLAVWNATTMVESKKRAERRVCRCSM